MSYWKNRRVIVTGGAGFLGSHLVDALRLLDCKPFVPRSEQYDLTTVDGVCAMFGDAMTLWGEQGCETLFHLAATCGGIGLNRKQPATMWRDNLLMGSNLLDAAHFFDVSKFVGVGTVCSYPNHCPTPFSERSFWDGYPEETNAPYGLAKKMLLVGLQAYGAQFGLPWVYVVPTNLYGPRDHFDPESSHVIPAMIRKFLEAKRAGDHVVSLWGTGKPTRDFLYVGDCVRALLSAGELLVSGPYNVGSGREVSIVDLAHVVAKAVNYQGDVSFDASMPDGQPRRVLDSSKFAKLTGWQPEVSLEEGLDRIVKWYDMVQRLEDDERDMTTSCIAKGQRAPAGASPSV